MKNRNPAGKTLQDNIIAHIERGEGVVSITLFNPKPYRAKFELNESDGILIEKTKVMQKIGIPSL